MDEPSSRKKGFGGSHARSLDDKHRIVLPAGEWRNTFLDGGRATMWRDSLALWPEEGYADVCAFLRDRVRAGALEPDVLEAFREDAVDVRADTQGRLQLPSHLLAEAGIPEAQRTEVLLTGQEDHIQVWLASTRADYRSERSLSPRRVGGIVAEQRF